MYFKQILDDHCGCASYVVASRQSGDAAIIDPALVIEPYEAILRERDYRLRYVVDTHIHADHVSGARALARRHGAPLCLHAAAQVSYPFRPLADGDELALGSLLLRVVHTPGHRRELISLLVVNPARSSEPSMVLTGDCLLVGDVGRPDFGGGDASAQYESLTRLLRLPDWVEVFPGHFEGPCGRAMSGSPSTTIGFERLYNPLARLDRPAFVATLTDSIPARPLNMTAIEATNRGAAEMAWSMLTSAPPIPEVDVDVLEARMPNATVIDVREPSEYAAGHVPGALNVPQCDLAVRLGDLPRDRPLFMICHSGGRSRRAAQFLRQVGYEDVVSVHGGTAAWRAAGKPVATSDERPFVTLSAGSYASHAPALSWDL